MFSAKYIGYVDEMMLAFSAIHRKSRSNESKDLFILLGEVKAKLLLNFEPDYNDLPQLEGSNYVPVRDVPTRNSTPPLPVVQNARIDAALDLMVRSAATMAQCENSPPAVAQQATISVEAAPATNQNPGRVICRIAVEGEDYILDGDRGNLTKAEKIAALDRGVACFVDGLIPKDVVYSGKYAKGISIHAPKGSFNGEDFNNLDKPNRIPGVGGTTWVAMRNTPELIEIMKTSFRDKDEPSYKKAVLMGKNAKFASGSSSEDEDHLDTMVGSEKKQVIVLSDKVQEPRPKCAKCGFYHLRLVACPEE
jgi:hypothetical protein